MKRILWGLIVACALASAAGDVGAQALNTVAFTGPIGQMSLSPDGNRIAVQKKTAAGWRIVVSKTDGTEQREITAGPGDDVEPCWRGDGKLIAFASNRGGNWDIYTVRPDGTGLRALTHTPTDERYPQWSPRAFELAYEKDPLSMPRTARSKAGLEPSDLKLLKSLAEGSGAWREFAEGLKPHIAARYYKLLFVEGKAGSRQIATMREDGKMRQTLSTGIGGAHVNPCWARDCRSIAFVVHRGQQDQVYSAAYPITTDLNDDLEKPRWGIESDQFRKSIKKLGPSQPWGTQIAWMPNGEYVAAAVGQQLTLLPDEPAMEEPVTVATDLVAPYGFAWLSDARTALYTTGRGAETKAATATVPGTLLDIVNIDDSGLIADAERALLSRNGFVATSRSYSQMFDVYEISDYDNQPIYVTSDSLLHVNHLLFDYTLRTVEADKLMPATLGLIEHYLDASLRQAKAAADPAVAESARANAAFFAVAAHLAMGDVNTGYKAPEKADPDDALAADRAAWRNRQNTHDVALLKKWTASLRTTVAALPPSVAGPVREELALIRSHRGLDTSPIFGGFLDQKPGEDVAADTRVDYSDFIPRGHYSRTEMLRRYFLMTRWLRAGPFRREPAFTQRALLLLAATDDKTLAVWRAVQRVNNEFVGGADDQNFDDYLDIARGIYGGRPSLAAIADKAKAGAFLSVVKELPGPKISPISGPSFRFLPAPATPDAEIMQGLVYNNDSPGVGTVSQPRYFALGLDVMAVLGSARARQLLDDMQFQGTFFKFDLKETEYAHYDRQFEKLRAAFAAWKPADWKRNLYIRTLYAMLPLLEPQRSARDPYVETTAWADKSLNAALGTWAELKHDTLPKQPTVTEMGSEGGISEAPLTDEPVGYVEPQPEVYRRLAEMVDAERKVLTETGYLTADLGQRLDTFAALISMVRKLEARQKSGRPFTAAQVQQLRFYGGFLEHLTLITGTGLKASLDEEDDMAIIADVSSAYSTALGKQLVLEEGVGRALPVYVAVTRNGHRELACGAIFTYYEFTHPADDRLTDEAWRTMLDGDKAPRMPAWTGSFMVPPGDSGDTPAGSEKEGED